MKEVKSRWYVEILDDSMECGCVAKSRIYLPCLRDVDYMKCLKKLWKRLCKMYKNMNVSVCAFLESQDGGELHNVSDWWTYEEMEYMEEAGVLYV